MHRPFSFAESKEWREMVSKTYSLEIKEVNLQGQNMIFYGNGKEFSNSPYITDGGNFQFENALSSEDFNKFNKPVLIKSRAELLINENLPHVLIKDYFTFVLDLSGGKEDVWKNKVKSKTRNQVRKTEKLDLEIKFGKLELLDDFYAVISKAWRDLGTPTHSKNFYKNIVLSLDNPKSYDSSFIVIYFEGKPVSCACLIFDDYSIHHPYAATLKEFNKHSINNALYWEIIQFAIRKDIKIFDLGRSREGQSTIRFKLSWGAEQVQLYYYYINKTEHKNDEDSKLIQFLINTWKKLPLPIANFLGPKFIYKVLK